MERHEIAIYSIACLIAITLLSLSVFAQVDTILVDNITKEVPIDITPIDTAPVDTASKEISYKEFNIQKNITYECEQDVKTGISTCRLPDFRLGSVSVKGTEYVQGQNGTLFVQVLDSSGQPFNSTLLCRLQLYAPNKTKIFDVGMTALQDGIFYHDFNPVPSTTGLYIASAECSVPVVANVSSREFFRANNTFFDYLSNGQGNSNTTLEFDGLTSSAFICLPDTLFQEEQPYDLFSYVDTVNATAIWSKSGGASGFVNVRMRVFKQTISTLITEQVGLQTFSNISVSTSTFQRLNFSISPRIFLNPTTERLAVDFCARRSTTGGALNDVIFYYNGNNSNTNSSLIKSTLTENVSIGFQQLRGTGEIHVSSPSQLGNTPPLFTTAETNTIWVILFILATFGFAFIVWRVAM